MASWINNQETLKSPDASFYQPKLEVFVSNIYANERIGISYLGPATEKPKFPETVTPQAAVESPGGALGPTN